MAEQSITKRCPQCKDFKSLSEFYKDRHRKDGRYNWCKICCVAYHHQKRYQQQRRITLIALLGGKCKKCGFDDWRGLQIDHINGGGNGEFQQAKNTYEYYKNIKRSIQSEENKYQLLCANCNQIKIYEQNESR